MFSLYGKHLNDDWLKNPRFILGSIIYGFGYAVTVHSEYIMRNLRPLNGIVKPSERYKIPYGGFFEYVTSPQYFGEITAFIGLNILSGAPSTIPVLLITLSNLVPRAKQNHKWYLKKFKDYPKDRLEIFPFIR